MTIPDYPEFDVDYDPDDDAPLYDDEVPEECPKCGIRHDPEKDCGAVQAAIDGVDYFHPEGSTVDPLTGMLWGERG